MHACRHKTLEVAQEVVRVRDQDRGCDDLPEELIHPVLVLQTKVMAAVHLKREILAAVVAAQEPLGVLQMLD